MQGGNSKNIGGKNIQGCRTSADHPQVRVREGQDEIAGEVPKRELGGGGPTKKKRKGVTRSVQRDPLYNLRGATNLVDTSMGKNLLRTDGN